MFIGAANGNVDGQRRGWALQQFRSNTQAGGQAAFDDEGPCIVRQHTGIEQQPCAAPVVFQTGWA